MLELWLNYQRDRKQMPAVNLGIRGAALLLGALALSMTLSKQVLALAPAASGAPLPIGTVVQSLPGGCTSTPQGGVNYYYCSGNFYRAVFQGNQLVYVTARP